MEVIYLGRLSKVQILYFLKPKIIEVLEEHEKTVFNSKDITSVMKYCKDNLGLTMSTKIEEFINFLVENNILKEYILLFENKEIKRYSLKTDLSIYELALSIRKNAYLSHYTALYLNNLTNNVPKNIYINVEQTLKENKNNILIQENIDKAFSKDLRITKNIYKSKDNYSKIFALNGKYTNNKGVKYISHHDSVLPVTNIERTLIDITVRPQYAGGTTEVLNAFKMAKEKVSINKLNAMLRQLNYIYPYHQAIGLYMEKAGYSEKQLNLLKKNPIKFNFYLTNNMKNPLFSHKWKIYYPRELT